MKIKTPGRNRTDESTPSARRRATSPEPARRQHAAASPTLDAPRALSLLSAGDAVTRHHAAMTLQRLIGNRATAHALGQLVDTTRIHQVAHAGVGGSGERMPHFDTLQRAFGHHDICHVQAYTGSAASTACRSIGAEAYAMGSKVAFSGPPSLHTAAHEAAHTVQQRAGVHLKGGVGEVGDPYERQADAVADAVTQGRSAEALLDAQTDAQTDPAASGNAPVQRTLTKLGWMNDEAHHVSVEALAGAMTSPLPGPYARFLPALASSSQEHMFATNQEGKVTLEEAKDVIASAKDSFAVNGSMWSFVLPDDGGWQDMTHALRNPGSELVKHDGAKGRKWLVTMDLSHLPHVTPMVLAGVKDLEIAQRTPSTTMVLTTGLRYESVVRNAGLIEEFGVLGNLIISVTPTPKDINAGKIALWVRTWFKDTYAAWEPMQMDPRHMGTHDGYNMGTVNHYHLIMPGGVSDSHKEAIIGKFAEYDEAEKQKARAEEQEKQKAKQSEQEKQSPPNPEEQVMRAFLNASGVSESDRKKQVMLRSVMAKNLRSPAAALQKWGTIKGSLDWKP